MTVEQNPLLALKQELKSLKIDYFLLPNNDSFLSEYLPESEKRLEFISSFSGSNAFIIINSSNDKSVFFTDGRYTLQSRQQIDQKQFVIYNLTDCTPLKWLSDNVKEKKTVGFDPNLHSINEIKSYQKHNIQLQTIEVNPVDKIWKNRPASKNSKVIIQPLKYTGKWAKEKISDITSQFTKGTNALILNHPPSICWLFNIRALDIKYTPLALCQAIIYKDQNADLFIDPNRLDSKVKKHLSKVRIFNPHQFEERLKKIRKQKVEIDPYLSNYNIYLQLVKNNIDINPQTDPCLIKKACKNKTEINGTIKAHQEDGLAVTKFIFWLEKAVKNKEKISEISAAEKLLEFRKINKNFLYPSFATISGFGSNGAIVHYSVTEKSNKQFKSNSLYLFDSGGQYPYGTTDITRTVAIGKPTKEQISDFTRVLKGHINIARAKFPNGTSGSALDSIARYDLWQDQKDYGHGTGHGVGSFLSVHEGPQSISKAINPTAFKEGMILSNEPGYYREGEYGIRIENLMIVKKTSSSFLNFQTITLAPIDYKLIDFKMLTYPQRKWLQDYHLEIYQKLSDNLDKDERLWLKKIVEFYKDKLLNT